MNTNLDPYDYITSGSGSTEDVLNCYDLSNNQTVNCLSGNSHPLILNYDNSEDSKTFTLDEELPTKTLGQCDISPISFIGTVKTLNFNDDSDSDDKLTTKQLLSSDQTEQ